MSEKRRSKLFTILVFLALAFGSLEFVTWISQMAFENTCIELQEQYIGTEVGEVIDTIENAVDFGKELENYYGMDELLARVCKISKGNLRALITGSDGTPLYLSFDESPDNVSLLAQIYADGYQKQLAAVTEDTASGEQLALEGSNSLVFPVYKNKDTLIGHMIVIYQEKALVDRESSDVIGKTLFLVWLVTSILLLLFFAVKERSDQEKWYIRYMPVILIMAGMFTFILFLYNTYQEKYDVMISRNAQSAADYIQSSVEDLVDKGLPIEKIGEVSGYLNKKVESNAAVGSIAVVKKYYDTNDVLKNADSTVLHLPVANHAAYIDVAVSQSFINEKIRLMTLTFGAIFVICLMITYELTHLAEVIAARLSRDFNSETDAQMVGIGAQIKLLSFLAYTAIYTSMPYAAVIMRNWDVSVFGFSKSVSASLPLTIELLCIMLCSVVIQKVFKDMRMDRLVFFVFPFLILGNLACMKVTSPYILIGLRAFCGVGFAFLKYWMNSFVAAGSKDSAAIGKNYAQLNAGLLGGITVGASLGSILAQSFGYQFNYLFTALLCGFLIVFALLFIPWRMLNTRRSNAVEAAQKSPVKIGQLLKNPSVLKAIVLGDVPLNIGLMYVVSFLPVYMNNVGQPAIVTSYAYLVNGLAGIYVGVVLMTVLKGLSPKVGSVTALALGASGILVLVAGSNVGIIMVSAGIMGLFDGYGTPTITSFFTGLPAVRQADTASMLTVFNSVGSAVQIVCPMLYNLIVQPGGQTLYLLIFGVCFAAVAVLFSVLFRARELA